MPLYEYKCRECASTFDADQRFSDQPFLHCKSCGGGVYRVIHAPMIQFVGSGFYANDNKNSVGVATSVPVGRGDESVREQS